VVPDARRDLAYTTKNLAVERLDFLLGAARRQGRLEQFRLASGRARPYPSLRRGNERCANVASICWVSALKKKSDGPALRVGWAHSWKTREGNDDQRRSSQDRQLPQVCLVLRQHEVVVICRRHHRAFAEAGSSSARSAADAPALTFGAASF